MFRLSVLYETCLHSRREIAFILYKNESWPMSFLRSGSAELTADCTDRRPRRAKRRRPIRSHLNPHLLNLAQKLVKPRVPARLLVVPHGPLKWSRFQASGSSARIRPGAERVPGKVSLGRPARRPIGFSRGACCSALRSDKTDTELSLIGIPFKCVPMNFSYESIARHS